MKHPDQALVLAAGFGTRLLPLTLCRPKPLVPVWGTPILRHVLTLLRDWGVRDALINLHHGAGAIVDHLRLHPVPGLRCSFSFEPDILGTGGALPRAAWFFGGAPFWMMNADVLGDLPPQPLLNAFESHRAIAALWLHPTLGPRTVETRDGLITSFRSKAPAARGTCTFCGLQLLSPRILRFVPSTGESSVITAYEAAMRHGERIAGVAIPDVYWSDIGTPSDYRAAHRETRACARQGRRGSRFAPPSSMGGNDTFVSFGARCHISPKAEVSDSILWDGVTLRPSARVRDAIVADDVTVAGHASYMALRADRLDDVVLQRVIAALGWSTDTTVVLPLPPRGSARTFTRLQQGPRRAMLVRYSLERPENGLYASHSRFLLRHGLRVPRVLLDWPSDCLCVMEDAGEVSLQELVPAMSRARRFAAYRDVLTDVVALHDRATHAARRSRMELCPPFTRHLYAWEQNLFCEEFLTRHVRPTPAQDKAIRRELRRVIPALLRVPQTLIHRDLQSSNVLLQRGHPVLIDFQGMRFGAPAYDMASLLCDPYVRLPVALRDELLAHYVAHAPGGDAVAGTFWFAAVERLVQALGAFGRLGAIPDTRRFLRYFPPAIAELRAAVMRVGRMPCLEDVLAAYAAKTTTGENPCS